MNDNDDMLPTGSNGDDENEEEMGFMDETGFVDEEDFDDMDFMDDYDELEDPVQRSLEIVDNNLDKFMSITTADAVYGMPIEHSGTLIIPAAELVSAMGFGLGYGRPETTINEESEVIDHGDNAGGGGGGYAFSRPVAVIVASEEGVRVEPVIDVTKLALAGLTAFGFMIGTLIKITRGR